MSDIYQMLNILIEEGFSLDEVKKSDVAIAFLSLRSALRAWYETYQCFRWDFYLVDPNYKIPIPSESEEDPVQYERLIRQQIHSSQYFELYSETIFHFHHFIELIIKDILRKEHELLASNSSRDSLILYKLLKGEEISIDEQRKLTTVAFNEALKRIIKLIDNNKLDIDKYKFLKEGRPVFEKLNNLRNRLVHRGTFVLPYAALDEFIGKHLLSIIITILDLPEYREREYLWKYQPLKSRIEPLNRIIAGFNDKNIDFGKIAFLKELGRAAYQNPIKTRGFYIDQGDRQRAEIAANQVKKEGKAGVYDVLDCPVCGCKSLVRFFDIESENPDPEYPGKVWLQTINVQCYCCTFEITNRIKNASDYDIALDDYWLGEEISS